MRQENEANEANEANFEIVLRNTMVALSHLCFCDVFFANYFERRSCLSHCAKVLEMWGFQND